MGTKIEDIKFYMSELKSRECQCGNGKDRGKSFCGKCYFALPHDMRVALYKKIGNGYEEAYDEAIKYLND